MDSLAGSPQGFWGRESPSVSCVPTPLPSITMRKREGSTPRGPSWAIICGSHLSPTLTGTASTSRVLPTFLKTRSTPIRRELRQRTERTQTQMLTLPLRFYFLNFPIHERRMPPSNGYARLALITSSEG
jgi:hypothetical protein